MAKPIGNSLARRIEQSSSDDVDKAYDGTFGMNIDSDVEKIVEILPPYSARIRLTHSSHILKDKLEELADSIARLGLLDAILVRPDKKGGYQILAGKNRTNAIRLNGNPP